MVISPWAKKNYVSHVHYSFGSIFKTFWNILGLPYLNQYDAGASDLADFFTGTPDFTAYKAVPVDQRIFDPQKALDPYDEQFNWKALEGSPVLDDLRDLASAGVQILSCGTCLTFFGLTEKLGVGSISNMYAIAEALLGAGKVVSP